MDTNAAPWNFAPAMSRIGDEGDARLASTPDHTQEQESSLAGAARAERSVELSASVTIGERYQIKRLLGEGGMGRVYLARDLRLGRRVAIKVIRPERFDQRAVANLGREARTTAKFNHPNIVTIYDTGFHDQLPYLALEFVAGQSLKARLDEGPLSLDEILRLGRTLADVLVHAHGHQILHCDLKPSNVIIPPDGRIRVLDFGLATLADPHRKLSPAGTPHYMAPEQWRGDPLTSAVDIWALCLILHQLLAGQHPLPTGGGWEHLRGALLDPLHPLPRLNRPDLSSQISSLIDRGLSRDPSARPPAVEMLRTLDRGLATWDAWASETAPYRGLAAFEEAHSRYFIGRELEVDAILERLRREPFLPVVGASGIGKSSLVLAGVLPRLRARASWTFIELRPGNEPFRSLARALLNADTWTPQDVTNEAVDELAQELEKEPGKIHLLLHAFAVARRTRVLLFVDQLEELFSSASDPGQRERFLHLIMHAADDAQEPIRVLCTLRDDFLGRIPQLDRLFVLAPLGRMQLRRTIVEPLARAGFAFDDPTLPDRMVADLEGNAADLPLLQFTCWRLWESRDQAQRSLLRSVYEAEGGVRGSLAMHADRVLSEMSESDSLLVRRLLLALVSHERTRIVLPEARAAGGLGSRSEKIVDALIKSRLVVTARGADGGSTLELAHDSLIESWGLLRSWLDEIDGDQAARDQLERSAELWKIRGRREELTWPAEEIADVRRRAERVGFHFSETAEEFLRDGERRAIRTRIRNRTAIGLALAVLSVVAVASLLLAREYRERQLLAEEQTRALQLARDNVGSFRLVLRPFDWDERRLTAIPTPASALPRLRWRLHRVDPDDPSRPGPPLEEEQVVAHPVELGDALIAAVDAPGIAAFLRIDGRGRSDDCPPSWLRIQALPGYADRGATPPDVTVRVPTCEATEAGTRVVPAGPFIHDGPGEPRTRQEDEIRPERVIELAAFALDRTEVSNSQFAIFTELSRLTGIDPPRFPEAGLLAESGAPDHPVTSVTARTADAFCRFFGKTLPTPEQWTKAVRGGLFVDADGAVPNPHPRRLYPWGVAPNVAARSNIDRERRESRATMPVDSLPDGAGPYGHLHLTGNVREWMAKSNASSALRQIRGGGWSSPLEAMEQDSVFENHREPRYFDFSIGFRCALELDATEEGASTWQHR